MENKPKILFVPITAQPPTFGMVMSIMSISDQFDKIIICVKDEPIVLKTEVIIRMLDFIFKKPKYMLISNTYDFKTIHDMPVDLPKFNYFGALDDRTYTNLSSKGFVCFLLPKTIGYDELFHRSAFKQSQELDLLRMRMTLLSMKNMKKASEDAGGDDEE